LFGKIFLFNFVLILFSNLLFCQSIYDFYISQSSIRNPREEKVLLEIGVRLNMNELYNYKKFDFVFQNLLDIGYLYQKVNKKDEIVIPSQYKLKGDLMTKYKLGFHVDPFVATSYDTQIIPSFAKFGNNMEMTGKFRDPVTTNQSFGLAYMSKKNQDFLIAIVGLSARQIRADMFTQLTDNRQTPNIIENYVEDYGVQFKFDVNLNLDSTSLLRSNFEMFAKMQDETEYTFKFNNEFRTNLLKDVFVLIIRLDLIYDEKQSKQVQYNQVFRLGLNYKFSLL
jgi:hypothetical protein